MSEKKPCALESAGTALGADEPPDTRPCALLCANGAPASPAPAPAPTPSAPPENESADPVGDGHSDAEWAERHPKSS